MSNSNDEIVVAIAPRACKHCGRVFLCMPLSKSYYCGYICRSFGDTAHIKQPDPVFKMVTISLRPSKIKPRMDRYGSNIDIDW